MSTRYSNTILTIIALFLGAIVAKLYIPAAEQIGPQFSSPTRAEWAATKLVNDPKVRKAQQDAIKARLPYVWIYDGTVEVSGGYIDVTDRYGRLSVWVDGGSVSIER